MARDPPSLLASSELRDLSLQPSAILNARITIVHPQLRDLILPKERGCVLYPRGDLIEELRWTPTEDGDEDERNGKQPTPQEMTSGVAKPLVKLKFTPNCLTGSQGIIAAGGQHGEFHMSLYPPSDRWSTEKPFSLNVMLDTRSINNAIVILPEYPDGWKKAMKQRSAGYIGRGRSVYDTLEDSQPGNAPAASSSSGSQRGRIQEEMEIEEGDEEAMDLDDREDEDEDMVQPLSPATYPNTVPFRQRPRGPSFTAAESTSSARTTRRASSFSHNRVIARPEPSTNRASRQSFSSLSDNRQPPPRVVTSRSDIWANQGPVGRPVRRTLRQYDPDYGSMDIDLIGLPRGRSGSGSTDYEAVFGVPSRVIPDPRILISSNDQTVKMFSLCKHDASTSSTRNTQLPPAIHYPRQPQALPASSADWIDYQDAPIFSPPPPPFPENGFRWDAEELIHQSLADAHLAEQTAARREMRARDIEHFENFIGSTPDGVPETAWTQRQEAARAQRRQTNMIPEAPIPMRMADERSLAKTGGTVLGYPVNHTSFSPDLRTMVTVGDSTDVNLFEVVDGGRNFRKIATYNASSDSGFSSAWSKDGRKFAVASQDGQVTVWDHRSSRPLATLFTSVSSSASQTSSPTSDGWTREGRVMMIDPISGEPSSGASTSGREAARVVKFSPEGSDRDLMVFSEEHSNIHIVDAKTFHSHVVLPVPISASGNHTSTPRFSHRSGVEGGECGIAGIAFDPTGNWLYSGTERSVVEWDMRRYGGDEGGSWDMA